jgi:hypothetical protein
MMPENLEMAMTRRGDAISRAKTQPLSTISAKTNVSVCARKFVDFQTGAAGDHNVAPPGCNRATVTKAQC